MTIKALINKVYFGDPRVSEITEEAFLQAIEMLEDADQRELMRQRAAGRPLTKVYIKFTLSYNQLRGIEDRAIKAMRHPRIHRTLFEEV